MYRLEYQVATLPNGGASPMNFPYFYVSCPCTDVSVPIEEASSTRADDEEQERTFDPRSPRASFCLYPFDHLMYCEDCQQIRCPRCTVEEIVCWYCPGCLFEIPTSQIKSEGNRCQRNCFNCPVCLAPMTVNAVNRSDGHQIFILACGYCNWTSQEVGLEFSKVSRISAQLEEIYTKNARSAPGEPTELKSDRNPSTQVGSELAFTSLKTFLKSQLNEVHSDNPLLTPSGDINYSSPNSLARIMSLYTTLGSGKKSSQRPTAIRESVSVEEGLFLTCSTSEEEGIRKLRKEGYSTTTSPLQRSAQPQNSCTFTSDLRPIPMLFRTKRAKRCRTCRHILVKPEAKVENTRYRIRLLARNYIPTIRLKPLHASPSQAAINLDNVRPLQTSQFLLSLRNPLFDPVSVTLATPSRTPGRWGHKVTILCPQFEIGANTDAWDEALDTSSKTMSQQRIVKRFGDPRFEHVGQDGRLAEAGKVWEKGRNWTTVVVEVGIVDVDSEGEEEGNEDEDYLEIPVFVRLEWEAEAEEKGKEGAKEKRELAYWVVLGVGRVVKVTSA